MKRVSYYLIFIVIAGIALVSFWTYQQYFKQKDSSFLFFKVEKGFIQETIKARGSIVPQKDFDLEFSFPGIIEKIFVKEGQQVNNGEPLMKLETTDFGLEIKKLQAQLAGAEANLKAQQAKLDELKKGTRPEEIQIQEGNVANAKVSLEDSKKTLTNSLSDTFTKSDDAIRNKIDQFFNNPKGQNPTLTFNLSDGQLKNDIEWGRYGAESILNEWKILADNLTTNSDLDSITNASNSNLNSIKLLLDKVALAVNSLTPTASLSQTTIDTYKSSVSTARTNVNLAISGLSSAYEGYRSAKSNLSVQENQLILKKAGTTAEQITGQEEQVKQAGANIQNYQAQIAIIQEKIKKSTLYSPGSAEVNKIWFEAGEVFQSGKTAISLSTYDHKIQADISELEIGKIKEVDGNEVLILLDAFPGLELKGKITSIEPKEITKEGDKYYRINVYMESHGLEVRSGMNADLKILISSKADVLKIPEFAIYQKDGKKFILLLEEKGQREVEIETGISDGESIEIINGLSEGQTIAVSVD